MFQSLRASNQFYILHKDAVPYVEVGSVVSVSVPMPKFPLPTNFGQPQEMVVDVVVRVNDNNVTFQKLPANQEIADFGINGAIVVATSKEAMNSELSSLRQKSVDIINSVNFHKSVIDGCDKTLRDLNPEYAEKQQQQEEINTLKQNMEEMRRGMLFIWLDSAGNVSDINSLFNSLRIMKNQENIMKETSWLINMMNDEMPIYDFYLLKHYLISRIDKSKRAKRKKTTRNR